MGIKLDISVETPLSDDDRDILAGISVMVLAIANRQNLVDQAEASAQAEEDETGAALLRRPRARRQQLLHPGARSLRSAQVPHARLAGRASELRGAAGRGTACG